ncbi:MULTISPECIES: radical SAM protein [unclassified Streptomyces]|uniref:radical SAM protein n=1 Tax=unclassified Streptomyces TaxID=2593676 RepID=UPI00163DB296|nr:MULTISPECIES: radical SAM protein [unclassified Streptomyces]
MEYNNRLGRLRVSITHACQLRCTFCHREGIESHWSPRHMPTEVFRALLSAFGSMGGREVNVTGGDPLVHPRAGLVLEELQNFDGHRALCTNGLLLRRIYDQLRPDLIDEVKISVHASSDATGKKLLGAAWSSAVVVDGLKILSERRIPFTMNFSVTSENVAELPEVLERSRRIGANVLIIDLISTRWDTCQDSLNNVDFDAAVEKIAALCGDPVTIRDRTGCVLTRFTTPEGNTWTIKDVRNGVLFTGMCNACRLRTSCGEGVFALRVDSEHTLRPCLLRRDLDQPMEARLDPVDADDWQRALAEMIKKMMSPPYVLESPEQIYE